MGSRILRGCKALGSWLRQLGASGFSGFRGLGSLGSLGIRILARRVKFRV